MFTAMGQYLGARVVTMILFFAGVASTIWFWRHPEDLKTIWLTIKYVLVWLGVVLMLPWATFFVTSWVVAKDPNAVAALMLLGYLLIDAGLAFFLMGSLRGHNTLTWMVLLLGFLSAGVYNFKVCEFQADRLDGA